MMTVIEFSNPNIIHMMSVIGTTMIIEVNIVVLVIMIIIITLIM